MSNQPLKIIFAGTPDFAAVALKALLQTEHQIVAVYSQPDRPSGRGKKIVFGPVKQLAVENNIPVEQLNNFKQTESIEHLKNYQADLMIVVAYGLLLPLSILETPRYGCVNIHGSLLPRWRGAAPIQRAIEQGDKETGITIMQMDQGLDTGNMLLKLSCLIDADETSGSLHDKLADLGGKAITQYLKNFKPENYTKEQGEKQSEEKTCYAEKLSKKEAEIDWFSTTDAIERKIRAFNPWPVCFTYLGDKRLRIWQVKIIQEQKQTLASKEPGSIINFSSEGIQVVCGDQKILLLSRLQPDNAKAMDAGELINGHQSWFENNPVLKKINT